MGLHQVPQGDWVLYTGPAGARRSKLDDGRALIAAWQDAYAEVYALSPPEALVHEVLAVVHKATLEAPEVLPLDWSTYQPYRVPWLREAEGHDHNSAMHLASEELKALLHALGL